MRKEGSFRKTAKQLLDDSIHAGRSLAARHDGALLAYERLLRQVQSQSTLLRTSTRPRDYRTPLNAGANCSASIFSCTSTTPPTAVSPATRTPAYRTRLLGLIRSLPATA